MKFYTIIAFVDNKPGIMYRMADLFMKRKINIESMTVSDTDSHENSRFTITLYADENIIEKVVKQLYRIIEVAKIFEVEDKDIISKELAFVRVSTKNPAQRQEVENIANLFRAKIIYVEHNSLVIEKSGSEETISSMILLLKQFGIKESVRSGRIAMLKENGKDKAIHKKHVGLKPTSAVTGNIEVSAIKRVELMARSRPGVVSLAQGIPSFETPTHIKEAAKKAIDQDLVNKYTPGFGIEPLREAICTKVKQVNHIDAVPEQIVATHGAIEAVMATFLALFNPDDEIIIPTPDYASHITQVQIARHGGKPVYVPMNEGITWDFDPEKMAAAVSQKTKAILVCNPTNPTGKVYTREELKAIAHIARKHNLYIITDEMYEYFLYDKAEHISIGSFPEVADRTISIFGVSKSYAMTGWRLGYIVAGKHIAKQIFKIHDSLITCPAAVSQYAAIEALTGPQDCVQEFAQAFVRRRQIVLNELQKTDKLTLAAPMGAYYAFPRVNIPIDDFELSFKLINEAGVAVVPGSAFGLGGENHIRISFGGEDDNLKRGLRRLVKYMNSL